MKQPEIPIPEPLWWITITRGTPASRRAMVPALRVLFWFVPAGVVDWVLAVADGGAHSLLLTLAAAYLTLVIAVLTVNVRDGGKDTPPS